MDLVGDLTGGAVVVMAGVSLLDVVRPYFFVAMDLGPGVQDVLALLHVDSCDAAWTTTGS